MRIIIRILVAKSLNFTLMINVFDTIPKNVDIKLIEIHMELYEHYFWNVCCKNRNQN